VKRHSCVHVYAGYSLEKFARNSAAASLRSPSSRKKTKKFLNDPDVSLNEGCLKVYPTPRDVTHSLSLPPPSLSSPLSQLSLIFNVCPSFAPSARSALLVGLARSIQFTSSFFPIEVESAPNKGRKRTSSSGRKELQPLEGRAEKRRRRNIEGSGKFRSVKRSVENLSGA